MPATRPPAPIGRRVVLAAAALAPAVARGAPAGDPGLDAFLTGFMQRWQIPTASLAVARDGRLAYAQAFGFADLAKTRNATPRHSFRIASSSKPVTAVAVMQLVEQRRLSLDDHPFVMLAALGPPAGATMDARLHGITVRHLLEHSGGFDSTKIDPQFDLLRVAAAAFGRPAPASPADLVGYVMGQPLAFDPGTKYLYSNYGYNVLGRVIEHVTGLPYEAAVMQSTLRPAGAAHMALGRTKPADRLADEVEYWDDPTAPPGYSVWPDDPLPRPASYGSFSMEAIDAHGGWVARPVDLTRLLDAVGGTSGTQLLQPATLQAMLARPDLPQYRGADQYYALGWSVAPGRIVMTHNGALTWGTSSCIGRLAGGITFALCCNRLPTDLHSYVASMPDATAKAIASVTDWPAEDLYPRYG